MNTKDAHFRKFSIALPLAVIILVYLTGSTVLRNIVFQSPLHLWADGIVQSPDKRRPHENFGQALSTEGYYREALREFSAVLSLPDDGSVPLRDVYREIGVVYYRLGQFDAAINSWQKGLRYSPNDTGLLNNLAVVYYSQKSYDEAEAYAKAVLETDPFMPSTLNILGELYLRQSNYHEAFASFLRAIEQEPNVPGRFWNAALALTQLGRFDEALHYANRYLFLADNESAREEALMLMDKLKILKEGAHSEINP